MSDFTPEELKQLSRPLLEQINFSWIGNFLAHILLLILGLVASAVLVTIDVNVLKLPSWNSIVQFHIFFYSFAIHAFYIVAWLFFGVNYYLDAHQQAHTYWTIVLCATSLFQISLFHVLKKSKPWMKRCSLFVLPMQYLYFGYQMWIHHSTFAPEKLSHQTGAMGLLGAGVVQLCKHYDAIKFQLGWLEAICIVYAGMCFFAATQFQMYLDIKMGIAHTNALKVYFVLAIVWVVGCYIIYYVLDILKLIHIKQLSKNDVLSSQEVIDIPYQVVPQQEIDHELLSDDNDLFDHTTV